MATETDNIPQWKLELIQRRKNKPVSSSSSLGSSSSSTCLKTPQSSKVRTNGINSSGSGSASEIPQVLKTATGGVPSHHKFELELPGVGQKSVCCKMRLEPDAYLHPDSSDCEELAYGPGIVNRLRSKYLNLTKENLTGSNFRRAASLEDLLGDDTRKFVKKSPAPGPGPGILPGGVALRTERFRNPSRGNDSMKRARSVETLMRYDLQDPDIILVDNSVKIESKLTPGVLKPKRLRPVLAETERPPPDLVKTTMRIFESTVKKVKPRGEVAVKVATFKGINDSLKGKKIVKVGKVHGNSEKVPGKVVQDGVVVEKIVKVSQAVSKFQQISGEISGDKKFEKKVKGKVGNFEEVKHNSGKVGSFEGESFDGRKVGDILGKVRIFEEEKFDGGKGKGKGERVGNFEKVANFIPETIDNEKLGESVEEKLDGEKLSGNVENFGNVTEKVENFEEENLNGKVLAKSDEWKILEESGEDKSGKLEILANVEKLKIFEKLEIVENFEEKLEEKIKNFDIVDTLEKLKENVETFEDLGVKKISKKSREEISKAGESVKFDFNDNNEVKNYLPGVNGGSEEKEIKTNGNGVEKNSSKGKEPKQIGIIRPLVSSKSLSSRELEKNLINRVKSIESEPTKVVVSLKNTEEVKNGGLWDKPWNQQNNTMVFNFSNRKDVPDYIENDGLIIRRKREKTKGDGIIVLDATLDASTTDDGDWELSGGPPSPCDVAFFNDNVLINGRSNLSRSPRNHKHRIQFNDGATKTFEYPSEASMLEDEGTCVDGGTSSSSATDRPDSGNLGNSGGLVTTLDSQAQLQQCNIGSAAAANPILV
ncbi:protein phosphatase 1-binding protein bifocal isoform X2 [Cotesia typhae]|uniref:protein phosphatase 1-binding protein bifocal isoform X2 n=1 Tax=Cotesia typhae TaxID=2053667 RepID=UPI003D682DAE